MRRLPPFPGAGEGPTQAAVETMATHLASLVAPLRARPTEDEETYLRRVLQLHGASTEQIRETVVQQMVQLMTPAVAALGGAAASAGGLKPRPKPMPPTMPPPRSGPPMGRRPPVVRLCADEDEEFEEFRIARITTQDYVAKAMGLGKTVEEVDKAVPREDDKWRTWYQIAETIAVAGRGEDLADQFNCQPKAPRYGPGIGRPSTFRFGNAVHAELQKRYLEAQPFWPNRVVVERLLFEAWPPGRPSRPKGKDLIELRASEEPTIEGALAWSMGSAETPYRLDIGDLTNLTAHEIKPVRSYGDGVLQLWQYVHNFNLSRYFDEQFAGAGDHGQRLKPGGAIPSILYPIDLERVLPEPRPWERKWVAVPWMLDAVPGVIAYTLVRKDKPGDGTPDGLHVAIKIAIGVALAVLALAAIHALLAAAPEIVAAAQTAAEAAWTTAEAKLITAEAVQQIGLTPIWDVVGADGAAEVVKQGLLKAAAG